MHSTKFKKKWNRFVLFIFIVTSMVTCLDNSYVNIKDTWFVFWFCQFLRIKTSLQAQLLFLCQPRWWETLGTRLFLCMFCSIVTCDVHCKQFVILTSPRWSCDSNLRVPTQRVLWLKTVLRYLTLWRVLRLSTIPPRWSCLGLTVFLPSSGSPTKIWKLRVWVCILKERYITILQGQFVCLTYT